MGVVYLAEDARLGRQVALKFLPASWSQEAKALERFRVEARAASSLSHPAICAIYDIGQDGDTPFIVMEALKGETLRERIAKGADEGHRCPRHRHPARGRPRGRARAGHRPPGHQARQHLPRRKEPGEGARFRAGEADGSPSSLSSSADTTSPDRSDAESNQMTQPGTALGTVSYMSPEQARGETIDSRTDLFSLGAVLYEMVTGSQAFGGSTTAVVYDAILNRAPRPIAHLNPLVPPRLEAVIATALEKDRELRYQHASDLQAELRRIRRDLDAGSLVGSQSVVRPRRGNSTPPPARRRRLPPAGNALDGAGRRSSSRCLACHRGRAVLLARTTSRPTIAPATPAAEAPAISSTQPAAPVDAAASRRAAGSDARGTHRARQTSPAPAPQPRPRSSASADETPQAPRGFAAATAARRHRLLRIQRQPGEVGCNNAAAGSSSLLPPPPAATRHPEEAKPQPSPALRQPPNGAAATRSGPTGDTTATRASPEPAASAHRPRLPSRRTKRRFAA